MADSCEMPVSLTREFSIIIEEPEAEYTLEVGGTRDPQNLALALAAARADIVRGRAAGDPRYFGYAEAALGPWWDVAEPPPSVQVLRATIRQNLHDFDAALSDLHEVLARDPRNAQAWLTRAMIELMNCLLAFLAT